MKRLEVLGTLCGCLQIAGTLMIVVAMIMIKILEKQLPTFVAVLIAIGGLTAIVNF